MQNTSPTGRRALALLIGLNLLVQPFVADAQPAGASSYGYQVPLNGMNQTVTQGQLEVSPAIHAFGTVVIGSTVATTTQVKNTGQEAVNVTGFNLVAPYSQSNSCPSVLVGGATCNVTVTYTPTATGTHNSVLTVTTSDPLVTGTFQVSATTVPQTTNLTLSGNSVDFGATDVGGAGANKALTITNAGNSPATVNGIGVSGTEFNQSNNCGAPLAPGASCTVNLTFFPAAYGARSSNLSLYEQASGTLYSVALTGSGNAAVMSVAPNAMTLASAIANYSTTTAQATVYNTGNLPLNGLSVATSASDYSVSASTCGSTLAAGTNCVVTVRFAPTAAGNRTGTLNAFSTNGGAASVSLSGSGIAQAPAASASVSTLAFGGVPVDGSSAPLQVTFNNTGNITLNLGGVDIVAGTTHYARSTTCGATLAVGASCTASVTFTPRAAGSVPGTLRATFSSGPLDVAFTGTGTLGVATVTPLTLSFADQQVASTSSVKTVTVTNSGNRKLTFSGVGIAAGGANFAQSNNCAEVLPAASCTISVTFMPSTSGALAGTLAMTHDGVDGVSSVDLSGTGRAPGAALSTPAFATTPVGSSATATAVLSNTGIGALTVTAPTAASVTGASYAFVSTTCGTSVAVGASCNVVLRFSPTTTAAANGALNMTTGAGPQSVTFTTTGVQGFATMSPTSLAFAARQSGTSSAAQVVTVSNTGTTTLIVSNVSFSAGATEYSQTNNCGAVAVGASCAVNVTFSPTTAGQRDGTLTLAHNGGGATSVALTGTAQAQSATLSTPVFPATPVGASSTAVATLSNTGIGALAVTVPTTTAAPAPGFSVVSTTCGASVAVGSSCTITVRFSPTSTTAASGTLSVMTGAGQKDVSLGSTGIQGYASITPANLTYAVQQNGTTSAVQVVTVTNTGTDTLTFTGVGISAGGSDFAQSNNCGAVAVNGTCTVNVTFTPSAAGSRPGTLSFTHNGGGIANVSLTGTGQVTSATLSTPTFPATPVGSSSTAIATLSNTGIGPLSVSVPNTSATSGAAYSFAATTCGTSVAAGSSCSVTVRFSPTSTATASGMLSVVTGAGQKDVVLGSTGIQGYASVSPGSLTYGTFGMWTTSPVQTVTVTNTGTDILTFTGVGISVGTTDFAQSNNCGAVAVGGTCTVNVTFSPSTAGARTGTLSFTHNGGGIANVALSGTGQYPSGSLSVGALASPQVGSSTTAVATYTNTGIGPMPIVPPDSSSVTGNPAFSFVSTTCSGSWVAVGSSCATTIRFTPTSNAAVTGNFALGDWMQWNNATLNGVGSQAVLTFSYQLGGTTVNWGSRQVGGSYNSAIVTLTNSGNTTASSLVVTPTSLWTLSSNTCTTSLAAGASCTFQMTFSPTAVQAYNGAVTATSTGAVVTNQMSVTGSGVGQSASLSTPSFPATAVGSSNTAVATLSNTGIGPLSVSVPTWTATSGAAYSFVSTDCTSSLAVGATCAVTVRFSPTSTAAATGVLAVVTGAGQQNVTLGSTGIQGYASMSPGSLTFGLTTVGSTSAVQTITVTNTGTNTLTFTGVGIATGGSNFGSSNGCGSVAVGGTCTVSVSFTPSTTGVIAGSVGFTHDGGGLAAVTLSGTGASYSWLSGSWATPSACGSTTSTRTVSCQRNDGATVADGFCSGTKPAATQGATDYGSCSYNFQYSGWATPAACGAVTQTRTASCLRSDGTTVPNASCGTPVTTQGGTDYSTCSYNFQYSGWATPAACGAVTQTRTASCQRSDGTTVSNAYCGTPTTSQGATDYSTCSYAWQASGFSTPAACGATTATRSVWCQRSDGTTVGDASCGGGKPAATTGTTDYSACGYSWQTGGWSTPSGCGAVTQTRSVWCQRSDGATVGDASCGGGKPASSQGSSDYGSCSYAFQYGGWSSPSGCGAVTQTRTASCQRSDGATVSNAYCGTPVTSQGSSDYGSCTYNFEYGGWSTPAGCGAVTQTRSAQCRRSDGTLVANGSCGSPVTSQGAADYSACTYNANIGGWSGCSNSCGAGTQSRSVSCTRSDGATVGNASCGSPATSQSCTGNTGCAPPAIVIDNVWVGQDSYGNCELTCSGHSPAGNGYPAWSYSFDDRNAGCYNANADCLDGLQGARGW